jgi:sporulation protein YlmC with PRC-barrel domain
MLFNTQHILGVKVETKSGENVGKVASFDFEGDTGHLKNMHVKHGGLIAGLMSEHLLVSWDAILEITPDKVVIMDAVVPFKSPAVNAVGSISPGPALMKE